MEKIILLVRGSEEETYESFSERIMAGARKIAADNQIKALSLTITVRKPPMLSVIPFKKYKIAAVSIHHNKKGSGRSWEEWEGLSGAYRVDEAIPRAYNKNWKDGVKSPGVNLLTLFQKRKDIDYSTFLDRWHNSHTPLSLRIHPLWNYNRNVVLEKQWGHAEPWDGIVEEHFRETSDLLNPVKFFGNPLKMFYRMWQVFSDTRSFLDYKTIEPYYTEEYHIKSE